MPLGLGEGSFFGPPKIFGGGIRIVGGQSLLPSGSSSLLSLAFGADLTTGIYRFGSGQIMLQLAGNDRFIFDGGVFRMRSTGSFGWSPSGPDTASDVRISRSAAGVFGVDNGTNPAGLQIFNTTNFGANVEYASLAFASNVFTISIVAGGTGILRGMVLGASGGTLAFYGGTPVAKAAAYTQTYATADKTHATPTSADIGAFTGGVVAFLDAAERDNVRTQYNALRADHLDLAQVVNALIDDMQALNLVG